MTENPNKMEVTRKLRDYYKHELKTSRGDIREATINTFCMVTGWCMQNGVTIKEFILVLEGLDEQVKPAFVEPVTTIGKIKRAIKLLQ